MQIEFLNVLLLDAKLLFQFVHFIAKVVVFAIQSVFFFLSFF